MLTIGVSNQMFSRSCLLEGKAGTTLKRLAILIVRALSTPAYAVTGSRSSATIPGSYLRSHYPKSRAKPTQTTTYSAAGFTSHLRMEGSNYNKPGQETILHQHSESTSTCTGS